MTLHLQSVFGKIGISLSVVSYFSYNNKKKQNKKKLTNNSSSLIHNSKNLYVKKRWVILSDKRNPT